MRPPPAAGPAASAAWTHKLAKIEAVVGRVCAGPNVTLIGQERRAAEFRAVLQFATPTLVRLPGAAPSLAGPVVVGLRYHERWLSHAPVSWEVATILSPVHVFHPSINPGGGLCLGHLAAGFSMEEVLHLTWAAIVFNTRIVNTVDWQVFRPEAAAFIRAHRDQFPITRRGLLEPADSA